MKKNILINLRVESDLKEDFQHIAEQNGYTMSELLYASMKAIVKRGYIPLNLYSSLPHKIKPAITIPEIKQAVEEILMRYKLNDKVKSVALFGSYAKGKQTPKSDIDLVIYSDTKDVLPLMGLKSDFQEVLGKDIDLVIDPDQNSYFGQIINNEKITLYEK